MHLSIVDSVSTHCGHLALLLRRRFIERTGPLYLHHTETAADGMERNEIPSSQGDEHHGSSAAPDETQPSHYFLVNRHHCPEPKCEEPCDIKGHTGQDQTTEIHDIVLREQ